MVVGGRQESPLTAATQAQYRRDLTGIFEWLKSQGVTTLEAVTPEIAGQYATAQLAAKAHRATINNHIKPAQSYWRWLMKRRGVKANPWDGTFSGAAGEAGQARVHRRRGAHVAIRPADPELHDMMRCLPLSGLRIEELYRLKVGECAGGWFDLQASKTPAGVRRVSIHTDLQEIVARRCQGKAADAFLFQEPKGTGERRANTTAVRFNHYRRRLGVDDRREGLRQSAITAHSFRKWFTTAALNAGVDTALVDHLTGHAPQGMTRSVYYAGPTDEMLRAAVESVRLPA